MTAATTVVGLIPLALGTTGMFELRYFPLARTVMGGLISSTLLNPGGPARLLHPLRRPGHMAQAHLVAEHSVPFVSRELAQSPPPTRL